MLIIDKTIDFLKQSKTPHLRNLKINKLNSLIYNKNLKDSKERELLITLTKPYLYIKNKKILSQR